MMYGRLGLPKVGVARTPSISNKVLHLYNCSFLTNDELANYINTFADRLCYIRPDVRNERLIFITVGHFSFSSLKSNYNKKI